MRILVVYGSTRGGTQGLAEMVGDALRTEGFSVDVAPAARSPLPLSYDAVVVGGALYAGRWHKEAKRFVKKYAGDLRTRPTYLFSSGPLGDSAVNKDIPPVRGVSRLMASIGSHEHVTFGGRLLADARGFPAAAMARKMAGDWRDPEQVEKWSSKIAADLRADLRKAG